jgi:hypothetical protein
MLVVGKLLEEKKIILLFNRKIIVSKEQKTVVSQGGCHCGVIRFQVIIDRWKVQDCNCSICRKKGFLHLIIPAENFTLLRGQEFLTTYTFNTRLARHNFCRICGIHSFYHPRSHPEGIDVNIRCLDLDLSNEFEVELFDGINWEANVSKIQTNG